MHPHHAADNTYHHGPTVDGSHYFAEVAHDMHSPYVYEGHHVQHGLYGQPYHDMAIPHHEIGPHGAAAYVGHHEFGHPLDHGVHGADHHEWQTEFGHATSEHLGYGHEFGFGHDGYL